ncbi:MAG: fibrobacter succinogenes major paralogous domain-containing protein [Saprospiraceae bacterium]|nr:fibrobacter succinogenes major paralogous domain-containing protein [Saprospiraceae bacterium]MBP7642088.1 fibrobacter succinogenes major paralogous domain-containing protein [Saprospiraceae bacterium]
MSAANWAVDGSGNAYRLTKIGAQTWIRQNLRTTKYNDGTDIPKVTDNATWAATSSPAYCWYGNDSINNFIPRGALYNQYVADSASNGNKNVCPIGFHVPSDAEFSVLNTFLGTDAGSKLKLIGTTYWLSPNHGATDQFLFSGVGTGTRIAFLGSFDGPPIIFGYFWTKTTQPSFSLGAFYGKLTWNLTSFVQEGGYKNQGMAIRCLKD